MLINKRGITRVMFCYQTGGPITGGGGGGGRWMGGLINGIVTYRTTACEHPGY